MWKELIIIALMVMTGLQWVYYQTRENPITATDAAFKIFMTTVGTGLTVLVLDKIWKYEEEKKWKSVKNEVSKLLSDEVYGIFTDFANILIPLIVVAGETPEEIFGKTEEHQLNELARLASGSREQIKRRLLEERHLINGDYGGLFDKRYAHLDDIDKKYGKFLEPKILRSLIDLQRHLQSLSGNIRTRGKLNGTTGHFLIPSIEEKIFYRVHEVMKSLQDLRTAKVLVPQNQPI